MTSEELGVVWDEVLRRHQGSRFDPALEPGLASSPAPATDNIQLSESLASRNASGESGRCETAAPAVSAVPNTSSSAIDDEGSGLTRTNFY